MREVIKQVTVKEIYDILQAKSKRPVSKGDFLFQLMNSFLLSPTLEMRFRDPEMNAVYILSHKEIAKALEEKKNPQVPSESRAGKGE